MGISDSVSFFSRTPYDWNQTPDIRSFFWDYLTLYRNSPALQEGALTIHTPRTQDVLVYERAADAETLLVAVNVRDNMSAQVPLPEAYADGGPHRCPHRREH